MEQNKAKYKRINTSDLILDFNNPRLPKSMGNKSEEEIINFFLSDASLVELMLAIGKNDFFEGEQLLVVENEENKFVVVEGNRRLSAVKLLQKPEIAKIYKSKVEQVINESIYFPKEIPCLVFKEKDEILKYLGFRHITGIKSWKLLEKARYIKKLKTDFFDKESINNASREIAKMIGSRKDYVIRILSGYELYNIIEKNGFYQIKDLNDTNFHFNYIADSLSRSNIEKYIGVDLSVDEPTLKVDHNHLHNWTRWLFDKSLPNKIIGDSEHLNLLNKILDEKHPQALKSFQSGDSLRVAYELTDGIKEQFEKSIDEAINHLAKADSLCHKQSEFRESLNDDLRNISSLIRKIKNVKDEIESDKKFDLL